MAVGAARAVARSNDPATATPPGAEKMGEREPCCPGCKHLGSQPKAGNTSTTRRGNEHDGASQLQLHQGLAPLSKTSGNGFWRYERLGYSIILWTW